MSLPRSILLNLTFLILISIIPTPGSPLQLEKDDNDLVSLWQSKGLNSLPILKEKLKFGTPMQKQQIIFLFKEKSIIALIPDVIEAILDATALPKEGDTGWGSICHLAATVMCQFAQRFDEKTQEERGREKFSFFDDGGVCPEPRKKEVHENWMEWWLSNKNQFLNYFETDSWPNEGIPVLAAKNSVLILYDSYSNDAPNFKYKYSKGSQITFDKSKQITKQPVMLRIKNTLLDITCSNEKLDLYPGDTIEYLQYRGEGFGTVRIKGKICELFLHNKKDDLEGLEHKPFTEWWIRVIDKNKKPIGWMLVNDDQLDFLPRRFN